MRRGMKLSLSGGLATMGRPCRMRSRQSLRFPNASAIAITGDGAMQMNGMNELITVSTYWQPGATRSIFFVANNRDLNQVTWEMRIESGDAEVSRIAGPARFSVRGLCANARLRGIRVDDPADIGEAWDAVSARRPPGVLEAVVDPEISMLPPHINPNRRSRLR